MVRPDGFEPPTPWFEASRSDESGILSIASH
jgi:hypothetical protein